MNPQDQSQTGTKRKKNDAGSGTDEDLSVAAASETSAMQRKKKRVNDPVRDKQQAARARDKRLLCCSRAVCSLRCLQSTNEEKQADHDVMDMTAPQDGSDQQREEERIGAEKAKQVSSCAVRDLDECNR